MISHEFPLRSCRSFCARRLSRFRRGGMTVGGLWGAVVALFLSTFVNKVDRKGRVSVPASFRAALAGQSFAGIVAYRSFKNSAIEGSGIDRLEEMSTRLDALDEFSEERESLASIFADSQQLAFDAEGRIVLPQLLAEHAGISET